MRALGFEPKKEEIKKMISDIDKDGSGNYHKVHRTSDVLILVSTNTRNNRFLRVLGNDDSEDE